MIWDVLKLISSHVFADFGTQNSRIALTKNTNLTSRLIHVFTVGAVFSFALSQSSVKNKLEILSINIFSHFLIDSFKKPLLLDQLYHLLFLVFSIWRIKR